MPKAMPHCWMTGTVSRSGVSRKATSLHPMQKEGARKSPMDIINPLLNPFYIKRTCPKCIQEFYPGDCRIVSTITHGKELKPAPTGWQQLVSRVMPEQIKGAYVLELAYRECPHCQYPLPANIELVDNINIAIIGDTFSGKSHYMAALIHQIRQGLLQRADRYARFACLTQKVEGDFIRDVLNPLFKDKISPPLTQKVTPPLIYELIMAPSPEHPASGLGSKRATRRLQSTCPACGHTEIRKG